MADVRSAVSCRLPVTMTARLMNCGRLSGHCSEEEAQYSHTIAGVEEVLAQLKELIAACEHSCS